MRISDWSLDVCSSDLDPSAAQRRMKGPAMSVLQVRNVNKSFAGLRALNDVNLMIEEGSVHAIIGPNGAGKSTLLNCFVGRLKPDTGSVEFNGTSLRSEEHTSELQSLMRISYAVFCLKKK